MPAHRSALVIAVLSALLAAGCLGTGVVDVDPDVEDALWAVHAEARLTPAKEAASEVSIAANPLDPNHLVAAANSGGGFGVYVTRDAGANWSATRFTAAAVDPLPGGAARFRGLSDPVVAFGPDGRVHLAGLAYIPTSAVFVATSTDGGETWSEVHLVHESNLGTEFNDKEWFAVSPTTGALVMAWQKEPAMDQLRAIEEAGGPDIDFGDVVVSRSTDGGKTWTDPAKVSRGMHNNGTQVAFTPDGRAHLLWVNYETGTLDYAASEDDGATWSTPRGVADVHIVLPFERYARMHTLPALVASPVGPELYAVWHDSRNGEVDDARCASSDQPKHCYGDPDVYAVASPDGGRTWTDEVRVNGDAVGNGAIQFYPWAAVDPEGRLHVTFYDSREDDHPRFHYRHALADGPDLRFRETGPVTSEPFTAFVSPGGDAEEHRNLGDYTGLAASPAGVFPAWADGRGDAVGVWAAKLTPPTP